MSDVSVTVAVRSLELGAGRSSVTASVTNAAAEAQRIVLGAYGLVPAAAPADGPTAPPADPAAWTTIERPLREIPAGGTEQYVVSLASAAAPMGTYDLKLIAYPADRAPEDYADQGQVVHVVVPAGAPPPQPAKKRPWLFILVAAGLLVLISAVAFALTRGGAVIVPDVVGDPAAEAESTLRAAGLEVELEVELGPEPLGVVVRQVPVALAEVAAGSSVALVVRGGFFLPDVAGMPVDAAVAQLGDAVSTAQETEESDAAAGTVIRTEPPRGTEVGQGSLVRLVVAKPRTVEVPVLVGRDLSSARDRLQAAGLGSQVVRGPLCSGFLQTCVVVSHVPGPSARVPLGTVVTLFTT